MSSRSRQVLGSFLILGIAACGQIEQTTESGSGPELDLQAALQQAPGAEKVRVIVQLSSMAGAASMASTLDAERSAGNSRVLRTYRNFPLLAVEVSVNALQALQRAPGVLAVTPDIPVPPSLDVSLGVINADAVHALGWDGSGQTVAILDTGIDQNHPFLAGRIVSQACYSTGGAGHDADAAVGRISLCPGNTMSSTAAGSADTDIVACNNNGDICDHGTHVAGIAAGNGAGVGVANAQAAGVAPGANIIAIQVFTRYNRAEDCPPPAPRRRACGAQRRT